MRWLFLVVSILVLSSIQFIAISHYPSAPDLLLIFAIFLALNTSRELALTGAWVCGLCWEVSGGQGGQEHIGVFVFLFTFFAWVLSRHRLELFTEHWVTRTLIVGFAGLICGISEIGVIRYETQQSVNWDGWGLMLRGALYTTLFSIPLIYLFTRAKRLYVGERG